MGSIMLFCSISCMALWPGHTISRTSASEFEVSEDNESNSFCTMYDLFQQTLLRL